MDRDILGLLENRGQELVLTPGLVAANTDWSRQAVREHMLRLQDHGLVEYYDEARSIYQLSNRGRAWLAGDLSTDDLEDDS
ncbi:MarR family transcriptional regulator [Haloplanus ruber]|uniref:MarR family transcriptional regulator n=1 Tax=Haloplanus ruber TaxID=869892 RepID=A0ABD6D218_9EURY|nr:MarR family transcriptional regulator [Haloplanus ruber]